MKSANLAVSFSSASLAAISSGERVATGETMGVTLLVFSPQLVKSANISLSVQNIGEKQLSFSISDLAYKGIYVKEGDSVKYIITVSNTGTRSASAYVEDILPEERLDIKFKITGENTRVLVLTPHGDRYTSICEEII